MLKLNKNYSDYTDETDVNYPEGKAVNASSSEDYDGTPLLAEFMNDVNAAHIAMYEKAYGNRDGINGKADTQKASQFADAVVKYTNDKVKAHADKRGLADGVHGATSAATPGQIVSRDEFGRAKFGAPLDDTDAARKVDVDTVQANLNAFKNSLGSAAGITAGSAQGNVPVIGTDLGTTDNNIVTTDTSGKLKPSGTVLGSAAGKTAGSAQGNVPLIGTDLGTTDNNIVTTDTSGKLKPSGTVLGSAAGKTAGSAQGNVPVNGAALGTTDNNVVLTNGSGDLKTAGITYGNMMRASNAGALCLTDKTTQIKEVTLTGFALYAGVTVKVMFIKGNSAANPMLNVNNTGVKYINVVKAGAKTIPLNHTGYWRGASYTSTEMWQPYTILEFMYDGYEWVIVGNPIVESYYNDTAGYTVTADGLIEQWGRATYFEEHKASVSFPVYFLNLNYYANWILNYEHFDANYAHQYKDKTLSGFTIVDFNVISSSNIIYKVEGY